MTTSEITPAQRDAYRAANQAPDARPWTDDMVDRLLGVQPHQVPFGAGRRGGNGDTNAAAVERAREFNRERQRRFKAKQSLAEKKAASRDAYLRGRYGITLAEYDTAVLARERRCDLCGNTPSVPLNVDHDHETGEVRGLLCATCNTGIGRLGGTAARILAALDYVRNPPRL